MYNASRRNVASDSDVVNVQGDQKVSVHMTITVQKTRKIQYFKQFQST